MFIHDFVIVDRSFGDGLARLPFILQRELASIVRMSWSEAQQSPVAPTVVIGQARRRHDAVVYPVAWSDPRSNVMAAFEADLELSIVDGWTTDLHLVGRCGLDEGLTSEQIRRQRREVVLAVRHLLEHMKQRLEDPWALEVSSSPAR